MQFELQRIEENVYQANYRIESDLGTEMYSFTASPNSDDNLDVLIKDEISGKTFDVELKKMPEYKKVDRSRLNDLNSPELEEDDLESANFPIRSDSDIHIPRGSYEGRIIAEMAYIHKLVDEGRAIYDFDHGPYFLP